MSVNIYFDLTSGRIFSNSTEVGRLNYSERLVFELLVKEKNKIVPKDDLLAAGWPGRVVVPNSLNIAIKSIRGTLERAGVHSEPETIPKMGYKLSADIIFINSELEIPQKGLTHSKNESDDSYNGKSSEHLITRQKYSENISYLKMLHSLESFFRRAYCFAYKYIYYFYVSTIFILSVALYLTRIVAEPEIHCVEYEKSRFCGSHTINKNDIPGEILNSDTGETYWFTERDNEFTFFKAS